jgi:hypothetical protein
MKHCYALILCDVRNICQESVGSETKDLFETLKNSVTQPDRLTLERFMRGDVVRTEQVRSITIPIPPHDTMAIKISRVSFFFQTRQILHLIGDRLVVFHHNDKLPTFSQLSRATEWN